ncbi:MAG: DUF6174 domain-containing protein [Treponema sp.]|jgi:hypothetical protein|nr:DUF6174 domain-containing protein [Treponema sp.]
MGKLIGLLLLFLLGLFVSCEDLFKYNVEVNFDKKTFTEQRQQWQVFQIKNYAYQLLASGFIGYDGIIIVENNNFKEDLPSHDYYKIDNFMHYATIDKIYETIEDIYNLYNSTEHSKSEYYLEAIYIEYDKTNHIPIKIDYKYYIPDNMAVDGTFYYEIKNFEKR